MPIITVTQFKTDCVSILNEATKSAAKTTITKRGKAIARFGPPKRSGYPSPEGRLAHLWSGFSDMEVSDFDMEWATDEDRLNY